MGCGSTTHREKKDLPQTAASVEGLYFVKKLISDVVCRFQNGPRIKPKVVHYDQVEPYRWLKLPNWLPLDSQPPQPGEQMEVVMEAEVETTVPDHLTFFSTLDIVPSTKTQTLPDPGSLSPESDSADCPQEVLATP